MIQQTPFVAAFQRSLSCLEKQHKLTSNLMQEVKKFKNIERKITEHDLITW